MTTRKLFMSDNTNCHFASQCSHVCFNLDLRYPVLLASAGAGGRVLCVFFYTGLFFAGLSSNISMLENTCRNVIDMGGKEENNINQILFFSKIKIVHVR